jgi:hypothetical protein
MTRLRNLLFNALVVVSLLLSLAMAGLWVRSYWVADVFQIDRGHGFFFLEATRGRLTLLDARINDETAWAYFKAQNHWGASYSRQRPYDPYPTRGTGVVVWDVGGLRYVVSDAASRGALLGRMLIIPIWMIIVPLVSFGLWGGLRLAPARRRSSRRRRGECAKCGYDLRATPERCPECGTISAKANV